MTLPVLRILISDTVMQIDYFAVLFDLERGIFTWKKLIEDAEGDSQKISR
jgi:hypothetical protein